MRQDNESIAQIIESIILLLKNNNEVAWVDYLENITSDYVHMDTRNDALMDIIKICSGGMCSFSDFGFPWELKEANIQLDALKDKLFNVATLEYHSRQTLQNNN